MYFRTTMTAAVAVTTTTDSSTEIVLHTSHINPLNTFKSMTIPHNAFAPKSTHKHTRTHRERERENKYINPVAMHLCVHGTACATQ